MLFYGDFEKKKKKADLGQCPMSHVSIHEMECM